MALEAALPTAGHEFLAKNSFADTSHTALRP